MRTPHTVFQNRRLLESAPRLIVLWIAVAVGIVNAGPRPVASNGAATQAEVVLQTTNVPTLAGTFQAVNDGFGDQTDPHLDCDRVSYTNDDFFGFLSIRYFDFATNTDHAIPGNGTGSRSDVAGGLVALTEASLSGPQIILFNTGTQTRSAVPGFQNSHPALGGNVVAFENRSFSTNPNESEISVYDLNTSTTTRLTNDDLFDKNPNVSPTGNAIVWEKCQTTGFGCDVYASIQTAPSVFSTTALTVGNGENRNPQTNGHIAVYISNRSGENDIYLQPLTGGPESHLSFPGDQRDVSIAGNLISFESSPTGPNSNYDIYVYDLGTAHLYRATNTAVNETLNDLAVCNGLARIVYAAPALDFNVYSFIFQIPSSAEDDIEDLIALVESFGLPRGPENSLTTKLDDALAALEANDSASACSHLTSFINECQAQSGKKLTEAQATQLINLASQIRTDLGCQ